MPIFGWLKPARFRAQVLKCKSAFKIQDLTPIALVTGLIWIPLTGFDA
jgi:hypothetical protein